MKILLSAHACNPERTSECIVGWRCLLSVAREHDVWLLTSERNREALLRARENGSLPPNVSLHFAGKPFIQKKNPMAAKLQEWPYYSAFLKSAAKVAQSLHKEVGFDLVHHATFATWRVAVPYGNLGIPFVIGPIGGGEIFNLKYSRYLSPQACFFEWCRNAATMISSLKPSIKKTYQDTSVILSANQETSAIVSRFIDDPEQKIIHLLVTSFPSEIISKYRLNHNKQINGTLRLAGGGTCEGRKGVMLVLQSLRILKQRGIPFHYTFAGSGPESKYLIKASQMMGLENEVDILPNLSREKYLKHLEETHVYLLPSLRDNSPVALMEAMLAKCVPVVAACNGPAVIVNDNCGFALPIDCPTKIITDMADIITKIHHNRSLISEYGERASIRIEECFDDQSYRQVINNSYKRAIIKHNNG